MKTEKIENNDLIICEEIITLKQVKRKNKNIPTKITSSFGAAQWLSGLIGDETQEHLIVISLDTQKNINSYSNVSVGTANQAISHPRDVVQRALMSNAASIILAHNHPSNNPNPSRNDIAFTERMKKVCDVVGINLVDHIIVAEDGHYYSFREETTIV